MRDLGDLRFVKSEIWEIGDVRIQRWEVWGFGGLRILRFGKYRIGQFREIWDIGEFGDEGDRRSSQIGRSEMKEFRNEGDRK